MKNSLLLALSFTIFTPVAFASEMCVIGGGLSNIQVPCSEIPADNAEVTSGNNSQPSAAEERARAEADVNRTQADVNRTQAALNRAALTRQEIEQQRTDRERADAEAARNTNSQNEANTQVAALNGVVAGQAGTFTNHGRMKQMDNQFTAGKCLRAVLQEFSPASNKPGACDDPAAVCGADTTDCDSTGGVTRFKAPEVNVNFQSPALCQQYFVGGGSVQNQDGARTFSFDFEKNAATPELKRKVCRLVASGCQLDPAKIGTTDSQIQAARDSYNHCVKTKASLQLHAVLVGMQKCTAIRSAGMGTTGFEENKKITTIDGKITCKNSDGLAFDYPSCSTFVTWYNTLTAAQTGVQMYNEGDKISTGMRAQNDAAQAVAQGNGQEAGVEASRKTIMASASAEERSKLFFLAKGAAITAQLAMFTDKDSIGRSCDTDSTCCDLFNANNDDKIRNADIFFPNGSEKQKMLAEVIRAGGEAALAAMKEQELRRQAAALKAIKDQMTAPDDLVDDGIMKFCQQFPQDQKCLGPGNRVVSGGAAFRGPSFSGQNMGLGDFGTAASEDLAVESGGASAIGGSGKSVSDIGSADKGALDAKAAFDAPAALKGGGGTFNSSGGGGGAGASASANGLSNDPGVEGDKKETPLKMTSKSASYEGGTAYNGGGYRAGAGDKKDVDANPFASMFGKDKGRSPSAVPEIDSPASDLFTKISNRYSEVQKRKALMDVR